MPTIALVLLIILLAGVFPGWGYSSAWGYGPSGMVGVLLVILIVMILMGRI